MKTGTLASASVLLAFIFFTPPAATRVTWDTELREAEVIRSKNGPEASLRYLGSLPSSLRTRRPTTVEGQYNRLRFMARDEASLARWSDANHHLEQCVQVTRDSGRRDLAAQGYVAQFNVLVKMDKLDDAVKALERSRELDSSLDPFILHAKGTLLANKGHLEEAVIVLKQSIDEFEAAKKTLHAAHVRFNLAKALCGLGRYDQAAEQDELAGREMPPQDKHLYFGNLGNLAYLRNDFSKAATLYRTAAEQTKTSNQFYYAGWLTNETTALIDSGNVTEAIARNRIESAVSEKVDIPELVPHVLLNEARILTRTGNLNGALAKLAKVLPIEQDPVNKIDAYSELTQIHLLRGDTKSAREAYQTGVKLMTLQQMEFLDAENQLFFAASCARLNQGYVAALINRGQFEEALEIADGSRAGLLRRNLHLSQSKDNSPGVAMYQEAARRSSSAYLVYWIAPEQSHLWAITGNAVSLFTLPREAELSAKIKRFQTLIQERGDSGAAGAELFNLLIGPARKQLGAVKNVVVVPDGPLHRINFETLRQGTAEARYWIEDVAVSAAPSLALLLAPSRPESTSRRILMVGDALEWNPNFPRLLNSQAELKEISAKFPEGDRKLLTQNSATPIALEKETLTDYRFIHVATHAVDNEHSPLESAIVLSSVNGRGMLTARDILKHPVNAEVISLSACGSAGVSSYSGEGLVGLAWAFLHSGAHSVVAAIWDVSDYSSPLLMSGLYEGLNQTLSAGEALRTAKLKLLQTGSKYAHPYYWGEFVLYRGASGNPIV